MQLCDRDMNTKQKTIFIHIGSPKTGSTSIQRSLSGKARLLKKHGYYYLQDSWYYSIALMKISSDDINSLDKEKSNYQKRIANVAANRLIISSEVFLVGLNTAFSDVSQMVKKLHYMVGDYNVKIIVYLRRQDTFIESSYGESICAGNSREFKEFCSISIDIYGLDWYRLLTLYAEYFGKENIIVRPYEKEQLKDGTVVTDFFSLLGIPFESIKQEANEYVNRSYNRSSLEIARICNSNLSKDDRRKLQLLLQASNVKQPFEDFSFFSPKERRELIDYYDESNSEVARTFLEKQDGVLFLEPIPENDHYMNEQLNCISIDKLAALVMNVFLEQDKTIRAQNTYTIILIKEMENLILKLLTKLKMRRMLKHVCRHGINFMRRI